MLGLYIFLGIYVFLNFLFSIYVYNKSKLFYQPAFIIHGDGLEKRKESLHEKYREFKKNDTLSFLRIFIGINLIFWVKFILLVLTCIILIIALSIFKVLCKNNTYLINSTVKLALMIVNLLIGLRTHGRRLECSEEYKKYFGDDYKISYDKGFSSIISNHTGWIDICVYLNRLTCGFIAKDEVASIPLIGTVSKQINCLFVKREDANNRQAILETIKKRQEESLANPKMSPFMIFPEGTVTSGKHVLKFKKGAFYSLLPLKPLIIKTNLWDQFHLSVGSAGLLVHFVRTLCHLYHDVEILELPIMAPTPFMYENYSKMHPEIKENWEIFAEVAREIYCNVGDFEKSDKTLRDSKEYSDTIHKRKKKDTLLITLENDKSMD